MKYIHVTSSPCYLVILSQLVFITNNTTSIKTTANIIITSTAMTATNGSIGSIATAATVDTIATVATPAIVVTAALYHSF